MSQSQVAPIGEGPNGYICYYKDKRVEVMASTTLQAQQTAVDHFQKGSRAKVKGYQITTGLAEKVGQPVVHVAVD